MIKEMKSTTDDVFEKLNQVAEDQKEMQSLTKRNGNSSAVAAG